MPSPANDRRAFLSGQAAMEALAGAAQAALDASDVSPGRDPPYLVRIGRRAMACRFEVLLAAGQHAAGSAAALCALERVDELEARLSVYRDSSELSHVNRQAAAVPVVVSSELFALLAQCVELWRATDRAFDITGGPLSRAWGFSRRQGALPGSEQLAAALAAVGSDKLALDAAAGTVRFLVPGMELNLGAIGKGYALDRAAEELNSAGVADYLFHGGQSSILARGHRPEATTESPGWIAAVLDPLRPGKPLAEIAIVDRAIGTSGSGTQFFRHGGRRYGHILDPRTGWPACGMWSATVVAPTAAEADALSTAFYVLGPEPALDYCRRRPEIGAVLVAVADDEGATIHAANLEGRLKLAATV
jgi:thiamine biosynthesis lipoprotein